MDQHQSDDELRETAEQGLRGQGSVVAAVQRLGKQIDDLKASVDDLAKPHWVLWATLVVGTIAAIASVILLFREP